VNHAIVELDEHIYDPYASHFPYDEAIYIDYPYFNRCLSPDKPPTEAWMGYVMLGSVETKYWHETDESKEDGERNRKIPIKEHKDSHQGIEESP